MAAPSWAVDAQPTQVAQGSAPQWAQQVAVPQAQQSAYDPQTISRMWTQNGGDPKVADMMGHIAFSESAGNPNAINPQSQAAGLFQINPQAHGEGKWTDPNVNVKKAIELYNNRKKNGELGFEDWADSMDKGADGGWGKYLAQYAADITPHNQTPLPPWTKGGVNKPVNTDPLKGNYNVIEQFSGHQDLPFMLFNAFVMDNFKAGGLHAQQVMDYWKPSQMGGKGNPAAVDAIYGLNSPGVIKAYENSGNPLLQGYAKLVKGNSWAAGALTFGEEWFNPMSWAEGAAIGKGAGLGLNAIKMIPGAEKAITNAMHILSSYRGIVAEHGEGPRNVIAAVGQRMSHADYDAHDKMMQVFAKTTPEEQEEIRRRQQRLVPKDFGDRNDELTKRADLARDLTRDMTAAKLATGAVKKSQVAGVKPDKATGINSFVYADGTKHEAGTGMKLYHEGKHVGTFDYDPGTYVGLAGQYSHPSSAYNNLLTEISGANVDGRGQRTSASLKHKTYNTIDEARQAGKTDDVGRALLSGDIDHAQIFKDFLSTGGKRVEFEKGMRELAQRHPDVITVPTSKAQAQQLLNSGKFIPIKDVANSKIDMSGDKGSNFMKQAWISPAFQKFLTDKNSLSAVLGTSIAERGGGNMLERWGNGFNQAYRAMIVANPAFHPFWNVAPNATTAAAMDRGITGGPHGLVDGILNQTRAMLGAGATVAHTLGLAPVVGGAFKPVAKTLDAVREGLEYPFLKAAQEYQDAIHTSLHAATEAASDVAGHYGAHAEFGAQRPVLGGNAGRVMTRDNAGKFSGATSREMLDRMLTKVDNWNKEGTFGARGEKAFSTTLFHQLYRKGGKFEHDPYGAAWAVREALGNYRNINPENWASKYIMFFPWLASNVPFWFRALTKAPQAINAGTESSRMQRENAGDPTAYQSNYPKLGIETYDPEQGERGIPLPFNTMEHFVQSAYDMTVGKKIDQGAQEGLAEFAARAKPGVGAAANTVLTHFDQRANPAGSYEGYNVMYDKNLPDQIPGDFAKQLAATSLPLPAPFVTRDIIQNGYDPQQMGNYIQEALGMGYLSNRQADSYKKAMNRPSAFVQKRATEFAKRQAGPNPMTEDQQIEYKAKTAKAYADMVKRIKASVELQKTKKGAAPSWATPTNTPSWANPTPVAQ